MPASHDELCETMWAILRYPGPPFQNSDHIDYLQFSLSWKGDMEEYMDAVAPHQNAE